jgi:chitinase
MTTPGCTGPMCTFVGKESAAAPGRCTNTKGYISNYEIRDIIASKANVQQLKTEEGDELIVYDGTEYVGWMSKQKYQERSGLNFGGTSDWAIDLDGDYDVGGGPGGLPGAGGSTTVIGGTTTVIGGTTTTISGPSGPITSVIGGTVCVSHTGQELR